MKRLLSMFKGLAHPGALSPIGLDIGSTWVKAVQLRIHRHALGAPASSRSGGSTPRRVRACRVVAAASFPRLRTTAITEGSGAAAGPALSGPEIARIASVLARQGFVGRRVVIGLPASMQLTAAVTLPPAGGGAPLDQIAIAQLADACRLESSQLVAAWWPVPSAQPGAAAGASSGAGIAVGARRKDVSGLIDRVQSGPDGRATRDGLEVEAVDTRGAALARAVAAMPFPAPAPMPVVPQPPSATGCPAQGAPLLPLTTIVDLGITEALLVVLHGDRPIFERSLQEAGLAALRQSLTSHLRIDATAADYLIGHLDEGAAGAAPGVAPVVVDAATQEEARELIDQFAETLAREISASRAYAASNIGQGGGGGAGGRVLLVGGGSALCQRIACRGLDDRAEGMNVSSPGLADLAAVDGFSTDVCGPSMLIAAGLAMNPLSGRAIEVGGAGAASELEAA